MSNKYEITLDETRRDKHDLVQQILSLLNSTRSIRKTKLMALVGLSSTQARQYLGFLESNRLIEISECRISITEKGLDHLEKCSHCPMFERINAIWKIINIVNINLRSEVRKVDK